MKTRTLRVHIDDLDKITNKHRKPTDVIALYVELAHQRASYDETEADHLDHASMVLAWSDGRLKRAYYKLVLLDLV